MSTTSVLVRGIVEVGTDAGQAHDLAMLGIGGGAQIWAVHLFECQQGPRHQGPGVMRIEDQLLASVVQGGADRPLGETALVVAPGVKLDAIVRAVQGEIRHRLEHLRARVQRGLQVGVGDVGPLETVGHADEGRVRGEGQALRQAGRRGGRVRERILARAGRRITLADLDVHERARVRPFARRVVEEPRVAAQRRPMPRGPQIRLVRDGVLKVAELVGRVRQKLDDGDADVRLAPFRPLGKRLREPIQHQLLEARVVLGEVIDDRCLDDRGGTGVDDQAIEVTLALDLEGEGHPRQLAVEAEEREVEAVGVFDAAVQDGELIGRVISADVGANDEDVAELVRVGRQRGPDQVLDRRDVVGQKEGVRGGEGQQSGGRDRPQDVDGGDAHAPRDYEVERPRALEGGRYRQEQVHQQNLLAEAVVGRQLVVEHLEEVDPVVDDVDGADDQDLILLGQCLQPGNEHVHDLLPLARVEDELPRIGDQRVGRGAPGDRQVGDRDAPLDEHVRQPVLHDHRQVQDQDASAQIDVGRHARPRRQALVLGHLDEVDAGEAGVRGQQARACLVRAAILRRRAKHGWSARRC